MNKLLILLFLFFAGSCLGWVGELFFRRYLDPVERKKKKFQNPGLFVGPYLPIYGTGLITLYLLGHIHFPGLQESHPYLEKAIIFLCMAACMTLIEFVAGMIFVNRMHLQLWDYTPYWGNIKGVICPLFSLIWYGVAAFYYLVVHSRVLKALDWLSQNLTFSFVIGFFYGVFIIDFVFTFQLITKIKALAEEYGIIVKYNAYKEKMDEIGEKTKERSRFIFAQMLSPKEFFVKYRGVFSVKRIATPFKMAADKMHRNKADDDMDDVNDVIDINEADDIDDVKK